MDLIVAPDRQYLLTFANLQFKMRLTVPSKIKVTRILPPLTFLKTHCE